MKEKLVNSASKISVVINTYNASLHLRDVISSVIDFDEIVVCDMESTDETVYIAKSMGCKVVVFPKGNISICEPARNFAIQSATNSWVLVVDADEIVTKELREYLYTQVTRDDCPDAFYIPRRNMFLGRYVHSSPDYQLRLVRKEKTNWPPIIHRPPKIDGVVKRIPNNIPKVYIKHLDDACVSKRLLKMNLYTEYEVEKRGKKKYGLFALLFRPLWFFLRCLFIQGAVRDGIRGIIRAYLASTYQVLVLSKIKERELINE